MFRTLFALLIICICFSSAPRTAYGDENYTYAELVATVVAGVINTMTVSNR